MTTLVQVAQLAGVTAATVSNVLRGRGKVGAQTRQRVQQNQRVAPAGNTDAEASAGLQARFEKSAKSLPDLLRRGRRGQIRSARAR